MHEACKIYSKLCILCLFDFFCDLLAVLVDLIKDFFCMTHDKRIANVFFYSVSFNKPRQNHASSSQHKTNLLN